MPPAPKRKGENQVSADRVVLKELNSIHPSPRSLPFDDLPFEVGVSYEKDGQPQVHRRPHGLDVALVVGGCLGGGVVVGACLLLEEILVFAPTANPNADAAA